jgi:hypothetical protein
MPYCFAIVSMRTCGVEPTPYDPQFRLPTLFAYSMNSRRFVAPVFFAATTGPPAPLTIVR